MINGLNLTALLPSAARVSTSARVGTAAPASVNKASPADDASTKVMFGSQTPEIAAVYSLIPKKVNPAIAEQQHSQIQGLMGLASGGTSVSAFATLGSTLLSNLNDNRGDVVQTLRGADMGIARAPYDSAITMDIVTQSGTKVQLVMSQQDDGMTVQLKTDGEALNDDEAAAIAGLGKALGETLSGLGKQQPQLDISGLTQFDTRLLKSVDLKTDLRNDDKSLQSLNFHADNKTRSTAYEDGDFSLKMSSDMAHSAFAGNAAQQQIALSAWDSKFDKARTAGQGNYDQMAALKAVFRALNSNTSAEKMPVVATSAIRIGDNGASQLSGLNDFSLSLTQTEKSVNPAKLQEKDRFAYTASQSTEANAHSDSSKSVKQTTRSNLSAAWHQAIDPSIPLALGTQKSSQSYYYHVVENSEENSTTLNYNGRGQLANVAHHQQVDNRETVKKYLMGKLVDESLNPEKYSRSWGLDILGKL